MWLDAPTVNTHGALPGAVIPPYCADAAASGRVESLQDDQVRARRHACLCAAGVIPITGDDPRHVCAVPEIIVGCDASVDEVDERDDSRRSAGACGQIVVRGIDAGI